MKEEVIWDYSVPSKILKLVDSEGILTTDFLDDAKLVLPIFCVDTILIPKSKLPSAILFWRNNLIAANPNKYWVCGGRLRLGEKFEQAAERKVLSETGLKVLIKPENCLGVYNIIHRRTKNGEFLSYDESKLENEDPRGIYQTPTVCYFAMVPPYKIILNKIKSKDGHNNHKLFTKIEEGLDPYIKEVMKRAWKRIGFISSKT